MRKRNGRLRLRLYPFAKSHPTVKQMYSKYPWFVLISVTRDLPRSSNHFRSLATTLINILTVCSLTVVYLPTSMFQRPLYNHFDRLSAICIQHWDCSVMYS